ncbi:MAG: hypothetical protein EWV82_13410 [Microcystis aeruginosa Ma_AC_P_19900807_S299]|nr:MAG: hypothetical protein EWV82_13410 [Microcystis aeruginosa Ma_AC_P_19900807_S299]
MKISASAAAARAASLFSLRKKPNLQSYSGDSETPRQLLCILPTTPLPHYPTSPLPHYPTTPPPHLLLPCSLAPPDECPDRLESKYGKKIIYFREPLLNSPVLKL